jgi:hypothetical protein
MAAITTLAVAKRQSRSRDLIRCPPFSQPRMRGKKVHAARRPAMGSLGKTETFAFSRAWRRARTARGAVQAVRTLHPNCKEFNCLVVK